MCLNYVTIIFPIKNTRNNSPCRLHVPQVSFCHLHVPKLCYYHFPIKNTRNSSSCRLHVPQVSFCHLHAPKLCYYHFPYYYHIAPGKLLLVALMCQKQTSVIPIRKPCEDNFYNNFLPIQSSNSDLQLGENLSKLHFPNPRTRS